MAELTATPSAGVVGQPVSIVGTGFKAATLCTLTVEEEGFSSEILSDASGAFGSDDVADHATTTLTSSGVNVSENDTVTIGAITYKFVAAPAAAYDVDIGTDAEHSLLNLKNAINLTGTPGTDYDDATEIHPTVFAGVATATTLKLHAKTGGTAGNALASTEVAATLSFPGATFNSGTPGTAATGVSAMIWVPSKAGTFHVSATDDGTNTADLALRVWQSG